MRSKTAFLAISGLYFFSGLLGLVYEVTFNKYLSYVFGATAYASTAVLVAFMGGLALGGYLAARFDRRLENRLFCYGAVEVLVGLFCAISPLLFAAVARVYVAEARSLAFSLPVLGVLRCLLATTIVLVPATGMGATLALLAPTLSADGEGAELRRRRLAALYALNISGGALGSIMCAYALLPSLGLTGTLRAAALGNVAIGALAIALGRRRGPAEASTEAARTPERTDARQSLRHLHLLVLAVGSGLLVFGAEVVLVHLLSLVVGTSVYAFGLTLSIFLVCLGLGAWLSLRLGRAFGNGAVPIGVAIAALATVASVPVWDHLPRLFDVMGPHASGWAEREAVRGLVAFAALLVPATAMGTVFPLVLRDVAAEARVGALVGRLTAANTVGSIAGSIVVGFVVLPRMGSQKSLTAVAFSYAALALFALGWSWIVDRAIGLRQRILVALLALGAFAVGAVLPRWNLVELTSGANVYFEATTLPDAIEMVREDVHGGVTTVVRSGDILGLYTNGKFQGNNSYEMEAQRAFAHIPCVLARRHERAFAIGLGTGTTVGTLAAYPFSRIDVAEISPAITFAAGTYFADVNGGVLGDPRVRVLDEDGRNALLVSTEAYDLIGIEITSIWFAGAANLYSREFYDIVRRRLAEGGVLQQWIQMHHMRRRDLASVLATVRSAFAHVAMYAHGNQGILVAAEHPLVFSLGRAKDLDRRPEVRRLLADGSSLADLSSDLLMADDAVDRFIDDSAKEEHVQRGALLSTDDNLYLEYATPKNNVSGMPSIEQTTAMLARYGSGAARKESVAP
jgi:spermidine synthase